METDQFEDLNQQFGNNWTSERAIDALEKDTIFLGMLALKDPLRPKVAQVVEFAQKGRMHVRMVTGEHPETAKSIAIDAGILDKKFRELSDEDNSVCMTAEEFSQKVGGVKRM